MVKKNYQAGANADEKRVARAMLRNKHASLKYATELCRELKGKNSKDAVKLLLDIVAKKRHVPLRRYNSKIPHRKGNAVSKTKSGRYPLKTANVFLELMQNLKANADYKGLNGDNLIVTNIFASQGFARISFQSQGRISGKRRRKKSIHLEAVAIEGSG